MENKLKSTKAVPKVCDLREAEDKSWLYKPEVVVEVLAERVVDHQR